jgi:hypothetical protein
MEPAWRGLISFLIAFALLVGCLPTSENTAPPAWRFSDLRILDAAASSKDSYQLVSLYTRRYRSDLQIRLDLLDYELQDEFDLYLAIDYRPGGTNQLPIDAQANLDWDLLLIIPSSGPMKVMGPEGEIETGISLRVYRNPLLDNLTVSLNHAAIRDSFRIQAFLAEGGSSIPVSMLGPVRSDAQYIQRLPVTLAFWNTFHAYTPSQALRRLDGAHTGPSSDRHGLRGLLDAVESASFPVVILDLKTPASLSALDYTGALERVRKLASQGLLILPDTYLPYPHLSPMDNPPDWAIVDAALDASLVSQDFGLQPSPILYTATIPGAWPADLPREIRQHKLIFSNPPSSAVPHAEQYDSTFEETQLALWNPYSPGISRWQSSTIVDLFAFGQELLDTDQATYFGPSLEIRRALLEAASNPEAGTFVLLGGDLAQTAWGNPNAATQTLRYLKSRPWIQAMSAADLLSISPTRATNTQLTRTQAITDAELQLFIPSNPDGEAAHSALTLDQIQGLLSEEFRRASHNTASELARQAYQALMAPPLFSHPDLAYLRANYIGQIGHLLAASRWEDSGPQTFCPSLEAMGICISAQDLDWDGEEEYVMANQEIFLLFEPRGGYLSVAFWRAKDAVHQFIAPSSQFFVGMGDPMSWDPGKGVAGDVGHYRGAFSDIQTGFSSPGWSHYEVQVMPDSLSFSAPDGSLQKSFGISATGFTVNYRTSVPLTVQISLATDPGLRFLPGWGKRYTNTPLSGGWQWGHEDGLQVQILSAGDFKFNAFTDSYEYMGHPENPDLDFPPGHFLPFPMAVGEIKADREFSIEISVIEP